MSVFVGGPFLNGGEGGPWSEVTFTEASARFIDGLASGIQNAPPIIVMLENSGKPMYSPAFIPVAIGLVIGNFNYEPASPFVLFGEEFGESVSICAVQGRVYMEYGDNVVTTGDSPVDIYFGEGGDEILKDGWTARYFIFNG